MRYMLSRRSLPLFALLAFGAPLVAQTPSAAPPKAGAAASAGTKSQSAMQPATKSGQQGSKTAQSASAGSAQAGSKTAQARAAASAKKAKKGKKAPEPPPQAQVPAPPPPPPTPAQLPPQPARVSMRDGLLTIEANNSTLADVLAGVRRETKAAIDLPPGASGERVVANLGPGTPQNVLASLFNGSRFDYIIVGSEDQPQAVQRVILRAKSGPEPASGGPPIVAQRAPNGANVQPAEQPDEGEDQGAPAEEAPKEKKTH